MLETRTSVVIATRNRRTELIRTLERLAALPERPPLIVVDNGSTDGTADSVRERHPGVRLICLETNQGGGARNVGIAAARSEYVALCDDDSWWAPGALEAAERALDRHPTLALVAARVLVGPEQRLDPTSAEMARSPLAAGAPMPGPPVLGFVASGAVVRRSAFLETAGFEARFGIGGEEGLLALDLAVAGYDLAYVADVVAHHHPPGDGDPSRRRRQRLRNELWAVWLRRPLPSALGRTARLLADAARHPSATPGVVEALRRSGWVRRERRPVPPALDRALRSL